MEGKTNAHIKFILHFLRPYLGSLGVVFACLLLEVLIVSAFPFSFKFVIDNALLSKNLYILIVILVVLTVAGILEVFVGIYEDYLFTGIISKVICDIRTKIFSQLQVLPVNFYAKKKTGDLLTHFSGDLLSIENMVTEINSSLVTPVLFVITDFILLIILNFGLFLFTLLAGIIVSIGPRLISSYVAVESFQRKELDADLLSFVHENIVLQTVIRAFGLFTHINKLFLKSSACLTSQIHRLYFLSFLSVRTVDLTSLLLQIFLLGAGAFMVFEAKLSVGSLMAFFLIFNNVLKELSGLARYSMSFMQDTAGVRRIQHFLHQKPIVVNSFNSLSTIFEKDITFQQVNFSYTNREHTIKDATFIIAKGSSVAFVGSSGSGKSTIINLMMRFLDPTSGSIKIDGVDLQNISPHSLQNLIGYVPQESLLFKATVRENILMGKLDATQEEVEVAAKLAEIHETILELPNGYDTVLEEQGGGLSVGQRQRIAIARAMVRQPKILVLDESTSALDAMTEIAINQTLQRITKNCTYISVTHRLQTIANFKHIVVLEKGRVCEQGTHEELLSLNDVYANMWRNQTGFVINKENDDIAIAPQRLQQIPLFREISLGFLTSMAAQFRASSFPTGKVIISEGEPGDTFYIIVRGRVGVFKKTQTEELKRVIVLEDGDYFGEIALVKAIPRVASIKAIAPTTCLSLRRNEFINLLSRYPALMAHIQHTLEVRLGLLL